MNIEEYFKALAEENKKVADAQKVLDLAVARKKQIEDELEKEYIRDNAKFKVGDEVRYANSPKGKKFIVKEIICVNYYVYHPLHKYSKADIRYKVETKNGWQPNGGWHISEDCLAKVG